MKTKYEYDVVSKQDPAMIFANGLQSREQARDEKRFIEEIYDASTKIIQRKYELTSEKVVR